MNFVQVCGVVTCAVVVAVGGCGDDREQATSDIVAESEVAAPDGDGDTATADVAALAATECTITISGPATAAIGPPVHLTATASCNVGTPEIQWRHRLLNGTFSTFQQYSLATTADFPTTNAALGVHQFQARVRSRGMTTPRFSSNIVNTTFTKDAVPCTAVALNAPTGGAVFRPGQAIALQATATCPAGVTPEYQYRARVAGNTEWTLVTGYVPGASSHTPGQPGSWEISAVARSVGSQVAFEVQSPAVAVRVADAPQAADDTLAVDEDHSGTVNVLANDADPNGDPLTATIGVGPTRGTATITGGIVTYTPAPDYHGTDSIGYTIDDGHGNTASATVVIAINAVNDAPHAHADAAELDEDTAATVDVVANDFDIDIEDVAIASITQPAHGIATVTDGHHVLYLPAPNFHGSDALSYTISDGHGGEASATLVLEVKSVNDAPVAVVDAASFDEDTEVTVDVVANDSDVADRDPLAITSVTEPAHGVATIIDDHHVRYVPEPNYHGSDSVVYTISDGQGGQASAALAFDVISVNDTPVAAVDAASLDEDTAATVDVVGNDSDVDLDALAIASITQPAHGVAAIADAHRVTYTPEPNFHGPDSLQYTISDGNGGQASATLSLDVVSVNDVPVAAVVDISTFDDTPVVVALVGTDIDHDALTFAIAAGPQHGSLGPIAGNQVTYTPAPGFTGADAFTYTASDGQASSPPASVAITVIQSVCGNGAREGVHEECDDGNTTLSDGCEPGCRLTCGSGTGADRSTVDAASGHCFAAYDGVQHSYQQAAAMCAGFGGHLATIGSASEDSAAFGAVHAGDTPWLGADDIAAEGTFGWTTGESIAGYTNFHAGKPDNAGNADCVKYLADGTWSDTACSGIAGVGGTLCETELATATPSFATGGLGTRGVAVTDLNGDGYADIAATNQTSNTVGVLFGNGAGGFAFQATYATGTGPSAVAAGDFNSDGSTDLAVVNATANTVTILLGTPTGAFVAGPTVAIAAGAASLAVADFDQDGALDLAIAANLTIQVLKGNGAGGFSALTSVLLTAVPASITAGDFDHDGRADLAVTTPVAILVVMSTGPGTFGLPLSLAVSINNRHVVAADLDADGNVDLAVANGAASISVFFGNPLGVFLAPITLTVGGTPQLVAAGDFDGDGGADLVALTSNFATLFHRTGRTFAAAGPTVAIGAGASFAVAASVNADAAADLVVTSSTTSTAGLLTGGLGGFTGGRALPAGTNTSATVSGDFNEDGRADLAVADPAGSRVVVFVQTPGGGLVQSAVLNTPVNAGPTYVVAGDFDANGHLDIASLNVSFSSVSVALGNGAGTFAAMVNTGTAQQPRRFAVGDFNADGKADLAVTSTFNNVNIVAIMVSTLPARFARATDVPGGVGPMGVVVADVNGDNKKDLAFSHTGEATVRVALGLGGALFGAPTAFAVASSGQAVAAADLDGDSKVDIAATGTATGSVSILHGDGAGGFAAAINVATGSLPSSVVAVDLDGDARGDLVVGNAGSNDVTVLHNDGLGGFVAFTAGIGAPAAWVSVADLDRDGHLDITASSGSPIVTTLYSGR